MAVVDAVIFENGSYSTKIGLASGGEPSHVFPTLIGYPNKDSNKEDLEPFYIGDEADERRNALIVHEPVRRGLIANWEEIERIWHYSYYSKLKVVPEEQPLVLIENLLNPVASRERVTAYVLEKLNCPAIYINNKPVLSIFSTGRITGAALCVGHDVTVAVCVNNGFAIPKSTKMLQFSGYGLTHFMGRLLAFNGFTALDPRDRQVPARVKEQFGYVALSFDDEMMRLDDDVMLRTYKIPGKKGGVRVTDERFRCPEGLFDPDYAGENVIGVHTLLEESIRSIKKQKEQLQYLENIVPSGGSTMFPGFRERLHVELEDSLRERGKKIPRELVARIYVQEPVAYRPWLGAARVSKMREFPNMWVSRDDYDRRGAKAVNKTSSIEMREEFFN